MSDRNDLVHPSFPEEFHGQFGCPERIEFQQREEPAAGVVHGESGHHCGRPRRTEDSGVSSEQDHAVIIGGDRLEPGVAHLAESGGDRGDFDSEFIRRVEDAVDGDSGAGVHDIRPECGGDCGDPPASCRAAPFLRNIGAGSVRKVQQPLVDQNLDAAACGVHRDVVPLHELTQRRDFSAGSVGPADDARFKVADERDGFSGGGSRFHQKRSSSQAGSSFLRGARIAGEISGANTARRHSSVSSQNTSSSGLSVISSTLSAAR